MENEYKMDMLDASMSEAGNGIDSTENLGDPKEFGEGYDESYEEDDGSGFRSRGRGGFRNGRGRPPHGWMNGHPRFRGRGYGPQGPPMRGRGFFRGRGTPRFSNAPNFDPNWGPMGPPPPGMMGGPPPFGPPPGMMPGGPMGPPPNMMGQPPPFGGPPPSGIPTMPNMPNQELWVETKSEDGKSYFYHSRTRETTWTRPQEGPGINCKIVSQAEIETMAASGGLNNMMMQSSQQQQMMPMAMGGPMANGGPMMQPGQGPPFMNQPPPWMKDNEFGAAQNQQQNQEEKTPAENDEMPPGESAPIQQSPMSQPPANNTMAFPGMPGGPNFTQAPPNYPPGGLGPGGPNASGGPPGGFPGPGGPPGGYPGGWGGWGGWPPPQMAQAPPNMATAAPDNGAPGLKKQTATAMQGQIPSGSSQRPGGSGPRPGSSGQRPGKSTGGPATPGLPGQVNMISEIIPLSDSPPPPKKEDLKIPPEVVTAAAAWTTHCSPDGRPYYYHAANQESVWEKPKPLRDLDEIQNKIIAERLKEKRKADFDNNKDIEVIDVDAHAEVQAEAEAETAAAIEAEKKSVAERERLLKERIEHEKEEKERLEKEKVEKEKAEKEKAKADKSRPVSSTPISGTPWCVVWTGDGRVFFYNPTAHTSVWERPAQLTGRADVDKAVSQPPQSLIDQQKKDGVAAVVVNKTVNGENKRTTDSEGSDSEPGRKKAKPEEKKQPNQIDLGKEAAIEAEVRAARERGVVPHEQRLRSFLQMLHEKQVSAFSTWEKELHKIVFDPRYLMLNSKERRQVFDQYVRDRAEEERKEKKNRLQQKKQVFRTLMEEGKLHPKSSFTEFAAKHSRDERFKSIEKVRDREIYFNEYIAELRKKEKDDKEKKREQVKADYLALLKEKAVDRHSRFQEIKKKIDSDPRFKAVEGGAAREDYFREYCKQLKDDRRKDKDSKERDRSVKKEKKDKERDKEKDGKEGKEKKKKEKGEAKKEEPAAAEEMETEEVELDSDSLAAKEKEARVQASIKEREKEVQRALATSLRDRDKEREQHKRDEAVQHFNALLADLVRNPELAWREAKKQLKKDHRYNLAELLTKEDKERLFTQHTSSLASKRRDKLRAILTDLGVGCTSHWKDVREQLKNEPTAPVYSSVSQMEREFRDFQRDKQSLAKTQLRQLLLETRSITHRSLAAVKDNSAAINAVNDTLKHDARYLALEHIPDERQAIITAYLEELDKKGPPPPPTATEPSRRPKP